MTRRLNGVWCLFTFPKLHQIIQKIPPTLLIRQPNIKDKYHLIQVMDFFNVNFFTWI